MRKLLLITYHFPPSASAGSFRMLGFARHLPKFDWQTVVVAPPQLPREPVDQAQLAQVPSDTGVIYVPFPEGRWARLLSRVAPYGIWLPRARRACLQAVQTHRPDAVLTSGPPHCIHHLGLMLKRRFQVPWVIDLRDPWGHRHKPVGPIRKRWEVLMEERVMKRADAIVANAPLARSTLQDAFPQYRDKIHVITNGYDPEQVLSAQEPPPLPGTVQIVYAGEVYLGRNPRPFLDAIKDLYGQSQNGRPPVQVTFLGRSSTEDCNLLMEIHQRGLGALVEIGGQVGYGRSLASMAQAHILLLLDAPGRRMGVPAKLYEYIGTGRPILALADPNSDVAWVLRESGIPHRIALPTEPAQIKAALAELIQLVTLRRTHSPGPDQLLRFTRENMAKQLVEILHPWGSRNEPDIALPASSLQA
jgi:glycosyltransferase involved in cell wall biosynthesis